MKMAAAILGATLAGLSLMGGAAQAAVVTFDSLSPALFSAGQSFSDGGLTFTNNGAFFMYVYDSTAPNSNGTNNNIFGRVPLDYETITKAGGGTFNLLSIDLAISFYNLEPSQVITINGAPLTITQTLTTYALNLLGVSQVNISGLPDGGYWLADNLVFTTDVVVTPLPATWLMLLGGFAGLGFFAYRGTRKDSAAFAAA